MVLGLWDFLLEKGGAMVREIGYQEAERLLDGAVMTGACE